MSAQQLTGWLIFTEDNPFTREANDARGALHTSTLANIAIGAAGGKRFIRPSDLMPRWEQQRPAKTAEEMQVAFEALRIAMDARKAKKK